MRAHDILGQRLSVLLRMIQNGEMVDYQLLKLLSKGLLEELKAEDDKRKAFDELMNIKKTFSSIGVEINFKGKLPDHEDQAHLFVDIIREASANAVRHGFATVINIDLEEDLESYSLLISNIGHTKEEPINPGSGLKTIRKKVEEQGGKLKISPFPQFTLSVVVPGGGKSD